MKKRTRSILEELNSIDCYKDVDHFIEMTASNIIESAINLIDKINRTYDIETSAELEKRFINSIKSNDPRKFKRGIKKVIESRERS